MAKQLLSASVAAPGFYGLNTQESSVNLSAGFALQADNCVIDKYGRLGARKGWEYVTTSGGTSTDINGAFEFIDIDGTRTVLSWSNDTFYSGTTTLAAVTDNSTAFATGNFSAATLNDKAFFVQSGDEPRYYDPVGNTVEDISTAGTTTTNLAAIDGANASMSAYGRLWLADTTSSKTTVYWSDLLDGTNFDTGSAGSIDLSSVLVKGNDEIVALAAMNGRLVILCKDNIVIYASAGDSILDPINMSLVEVITGVGCAARDSLQYTGSDLLFLSSQGLLSLGRVIQEKSQPMRDLSKNIRDELVNAVDQMDASTIKSAYSAEDAFYVLLLPQFERIYCFDTRSLLPDGAARVTIWDNQLHQSVFMINKVMHFAQEDGLARYATYQDNGVYYYMKYYTNFFDFEDATKLKVLKRIGVTAIGGNSQALVLKAGFDYVNDYRSYPTTLDNIQNYEYGIAEYNLSEFSFGTIVDQVRAPMGGDGNVIQIGLEAKIDGMPLSIQRLDIYVKDGRTY